MVGPIRPLCFHVSFLSSLCFQYFIVKCFRHKVLLAIRCNVTSVVLLNLEIWRVISSF